MTVQEEFLSYLRSRGISDQQAAALPQEQVQQYFKEFQMERTEFGSPREPEFGGGANVPKESYSMFGNGPSPIGNMDSIRRFTGGG